MKKINIFIIMLALLPSLLLAQDEGGATKKENSNKSLLGYWIAQGESPVRSPFACGYMIDNVTSVIPPTKTLEFVIQHRFGSMENGISDLFGVFGTANTRLALNYAFTDWLELGFGTAKNYKIQDLHLKINLLQQSRSGKIPLSLTYYGDWSLDARNESNFGKNYKFGNRFAFFNELIITREFTKWLTISAGASFTHFNQVDSLMDHDKIALHFAGRVKISPQSSIIFNYDWPLIVNSIKEWPTIKDPAKPNLGFGWEISTGMHVFQIFAGTSNFMVPQYNVMMNQNDFTKGKSRFYLGFNITRLWSY